jgi:hypothetical protein
LSEAIPIINLVDMSTRQFNYKIMTVPKFAFLLLLVSSQILFADDIDNIVKVQPEVWQKVKKQGTVPVMVNLRVPALMNKALDELAREKEIIAVQDKVFAELFGTQRTITREITKSPRLALEVDADALARLERSRHVTHVSLDAEQSDYDRVQELRTLIEKEIGTPTATEATQCKLIAFGSKPCGGPWSYLVYSTARTDEARLKQLVNEFNQLSKKINEETKVLSDCMYVTEPWIEFARGVCTIAPRDFRRAE